MSNIKCSRRNSVDSEETTGKRIKHGSTETMLTSDSFFYQSCFKPKSQPPLTGSEITESKTWHSVPENISAQSKTEYVGNCIHLADKFRWSCSRIHLQGLGFEYTWKNLGRVPLSPEKAIKVEGKFGIKRSLHNTDIDSNKCQLSQPAGSPQCVDYYLHSKSDTCGVSSESVGTCAHSLSSTQIDACECNLKQKETSSALPCEPVIINAEELIKSDKYKAERDLEADKFPCDIDVESSIGDTENLAACHIGFPAVVENRDCDCSVNCVSTGRIQQKSLKENDLESELSGMEIMVGERWVGDSSNLDFCCEVLETTLQPGGSNTGTEHKESMRQNTSCKTGALRSHSDLVTNEHPAHKRKDKDSVIAVEMTPRSDYINQRRHLMTLPELKPALIIVSVEQKALQSKTLKDNLPAEVVTGTLRNVVSKDLMSPHTVSKAHDEPEGVLSESCSCEEQIVATYPIPGSAEVLPGTDTAEEKLEVSQEKREKTDAVSSLGFTCSNSSVTSAKVEHRSVTVPLGNDIAESQADQCEEALSEREPYRTKTGFELEAEQIRKSWTETGDDQVSKEEEFKAHQGREEDLYKTSAVTLETCSLCQGDGADVALQGPSIISEQAVGRQGSEGCNSSKEQIGICEEPSPSEGKEGSPAKDTANPSKDGPLNLDVSDVFNYSAKRETHNACMLGLDNLSTCSTNSEEMDENSFHILGSNSSLHKAVQKPTKNGNSGKASRFLVFSKMTSFRKTKPTTAEKQGSSSFFGSKAKMDEPDAGKEDEDTESLQSFKSCSSGSAFHRKESYTSEYSDDDDLFYERPAGLFNRMSLRKASGSGRILMECVDTNSTSPTLATVKYADRQVSGSSENNDSEPVEYSGIRKSFPENEYKRNKNPEGKKFRTRLALAHKSLSSLFESRSPEKENTEQSSRVSLKNEKEKAKLRQSTWKAFLKSKEADGLKRPVLASLSPTQESLIAISSHIMRTMSVERQDSSNGHTFFKTETASGSSTDTNYFDSSVEPVDVSSPAGMWRKQIQSHDLGIRYSQTSDCDEQQEVLSNSLNTSLEEYWMKSPFSPTDLQLPFSQSSPSCPQLSNSPGKDMPCRPMSPKPQSPRSTSQHKSFRYPGRICANSMISLGNSSAVESNLEAPERPKTLKPRGSLLLSVHSLDNEYQRDDSGISSQSQISLNTASSISDMLRDEAGISPSITSAVVFDILPLKLHPFSQSTPTGLDCVGWKQCVSSPGVYTSLSWT
uniref:Rho guanine nucleotide exchange factor 4 n=1 Tax=Accipiter nisus TaxID=211598 RepID=A0A8B9NAA1_9AVES